MSTERELLGECRGLALKVIVQSQVAASPIAKAPAASERDLAPGYCEDPVGRAQRRLEGIKRIPDERKRIEATTQVRDDLAVEARARKSEVRLGRDFGKPEDRLWAGQWMHEHTVTEFVEHWGVPKQTAYRWRHEYRRSRGLVR